MKKKSILKRYEKWATNGYIDNVVYGENSSKEEANGLCYSTVAQDYPDLFELITPDCGHGYWGYHGDDSIETKNWRYEFSAFNPLRQNIVLLMAALNNEL